MWKSIKKALENTCLRGCLIYVVALGIIIAFSSANLGGLGARFGLGTSSTTPVIQVDNNQPTPVFVEDTPIPPEPTQTQPPAPATAVPNETSVNTPVQPITPLEGISGQATAPFYIVQPGDTLWDLAKKFNTTVEALREINSIGPNEFIQPKQLLYLPQAGR